MGYWGTLVALRGAADELASRGAEPRTHPGARRGDGWLVYDVPDNLLADADDVIPALAAASDAPVLAVYVADSDYGWMVGVSPSGRRWAAWLDGENAFAFERDHHVTRGMPKAEADRRAHQLISGFGSKPTEAARQAVHWAAEAGYVVRPGPIRQILETRRPPGIAAWLRVPWKRYVFAEEMFFALLDRLGIPRQD